MIEIGIRQQDIANRTVPGCACPARMQCGKRFDLRTQIGRGIDEKPMFTISADGETGLGLRRNSTLTRG
jgi:hypothetical protein